VKSAVLLAGILGLVACASERPVTLQALIEQHTVARGGARAIENVHSIRVSLEITEPEFTVRGEYVATRNGHARVDIYANGERVFTEALTIEGGWQLRKGETEATDLSEDGRRALLRGLIGNLYGLHELPALGYRLSLAGQVSLDGGEYWAIDQLAPDGFSKRLYIDRQTMLVVRERETTALHPDIEAERTDQVTFIDDYAAVGGVLFPRRTVKRDVATGNILQTIVVLDRQVNVPVDAAVFERPGGVEHSNQGMR